MLAACAATGERRSKPMGVNGFRSDFGCHFPLAPGRLKLLKNSRVFTFK